MNQTQEVSKCGKRYKKKVMEAKWQTVQNSIEKTFDLNFF